MDWNQITELPFFWQPFHSVGSPLALIRGGAGDRSRRSFASAYAMFKRRVGGVYFAIITQAVAAVLTILIIGQQGYTGGINGITDLRTLLGLGHPHRRRQGTFCTSSAVAFLLGCILIWRCFVLATPSSAASWSLMRDKEDRVRFSGYERRQFQDLRLLPAAAMFAAIGGAMFTLQVGFMSPSFVGIVPSIEMVIFCAVGGRMSLIGAIYGTLLVNCGQDEPVLGNASPNSGCSPWAACSSPWCCSSRTVSPDLVAITSSR